MRHLRKHIVGVIVGWAMVITATAPLLAQLAQQSAVYQPTLDRISVFITFQGTHGDLYDKYWNGRQWVWEDQGLPPGLPSFYFPGFLFPTAVYQPTLDRIVVFIIGDDGHLYDKFWNGQRWVWEDQGLPPGLKGSSPGVLHPQAVYQPTLDRIAVFVDGSDDHLYDKYWNGRQWVWEDQGLLPFGAQVQLHGTAVYQPTLDRIVVFVTGSVPGDKVHLYDKFWNGQQWVWEDQGLPFGEELFSYAPTAVYQPTLDRISVFVTGDDGHLYDKFWNGQQWVWEGQGLPTGGTFLTNPTAVYQPTLDRIIVFAGDTGGHLYDKYWNGHEWVWEDQGIPPGTNSVNTVMGAVYQPTLDRITVFVTGNDGSLHDKYWNGQEWVWENQGLPFP